MSPRLSFPELYPHETPNLLSDLLAGVYASPVAADGEIYLVDRDGKTVVIRDSDQLEPLATNQLDDRIDASPALAGRELFLRGHENLHCLSEWNTWFKFTSRQGAAHSLLTIQNTL